MIWAFYTNFAFVSCYFGLHYRSGNFYSFFASDVICNLATIYPSYLSLLSRFNFTILFIFHLLFFNSSAQKPVNDDCNSPILLPINDWLLSQDNHHATINKNELPPPVPYSCINTFENDLWYTIQTHSIKKPFKIIIVPYECNTPAGVQALLYSTYDCQKLNQNFIACATKDIADTITFVIPNPNEYSQLMLYVDGFDGTICQFRIGVFELENYHPFDFCKYLRFDYLPRTPNWNQNLSFQTQNNRIQILWTHEQPDILGYALQIQMKNGYKTLSCFNAQNYAFANQNFIEYIFNPDQLDSEKKCFRLLAYYKNEIWVSQDFCIEPNVIQNFWVSPPKASPNNQFTYIYKVNKNLKGEVRLKNKKGEIIKSRSVFLKKGNYEDAIDLNGLPNDTYFFEFCVGKDCFEYPLISP